MVRKVKVAKAIRIFTFYTRNLVFYQQLKKKFSLYKYIYIYLYIYLIIND